MRNTWPILVGLFVALFIQVSALSGADEATDRKPLWLVVARPTLVKPLQPLAARRREEGFEAIISTDSVEQTLRSTPRRPDFLLLVGDDEPGAEEQPWYLPARRMPLYRWREVQRREFVSDAVLGDLNADRIPDVPVGRIPARRPEQVESIVRKIIAYEKQPPALSDLHMAAWFGSPQYGAAIDAVANNVGLVMLRSRAPQWLCPWLVTGNARDSFCGCPSEQPDVFSRRLKQGGLANVLMGHASRRDFYSLKYRDRWIVYNASLAEGELASGPPAPPLFVFSCESGEFTGSDFCFAESLLLFPGGPVATIAATTESHPLTNYFSAVCLLQGFGQPRQRLGSFWLRAQRRALTTRDFLMEMTLRDVEGKLEPRIDVEKLRRDQILMYALLGDPATRLRLPERLVATVKRTDSGWHWQAERPPGATRIEVGFRSTPPLHVELTERPAKDDQARAALKTANDGFRFESLPAPPNAGTETWEGTVDRAGWLRLVAIGDTALHVAVLKLE